MPSTDLTRATPASSSSGYRVLGVILAVIGSQTIYTATNHWSMMQAHELPLTHADRAIPLLPWTTFVYLTDLPLCVSTYLHLRHHQARATYTYVLAYVFAVCTLCFLFFPTTYPRHLFPIPQGAAGAGILEWMRAMDTPRNAFPSLHVACCSAAILAFWHQPETRLRDWMHIVWAACIVVSTLTTKQHFLVDVVAGTACSVAFHFILRRFNSGATAV